MRGVPRGTDSTSRHRPRSHGDPGKTMHDNRRDNGTTRFSVASQNDAKKVHEWLNMGEPMFPNMGVSTSKAVMQHDGRYGWLFFFWLLRRGQTSRISDLQFWIRIMLIYTYHDPDTILWPSGNCFQSNHQHDF